MRDSGQPVTPERNSMLESMLPTDWLDSAIIYRRAQQAMASVPEVKPENIVRSINFDHDSLNFEVNLKEYEDLQRLNSPDVAEFSPFDSYRESSKSLHLHFHLRATVSAFFKSLWRTEEKYDLEWENPHLEKSQSVRKKHEPFASLFWRDLEARKKQSTTIRFFEFANLVLYGDDTRTDSLAMRLSDQKICLKESLNGRIDNTDNNRPIKGSILKSRVNQNFDSELQKAAVSESIGMDQFLEKVRNLAIERINNRPNLNEERLRQIRLYYTFNLI